MDGDDQNAPASRAARSTRLGIYSRPMQKGLSHIDVTAAALSVLWFVIAGIFFLVRPSDIDVSQFLMAVMAILMPVAMIWLAASAARSARVMKEESAHLQAAIETIRHVYMAEQQSNKPSAEREFSKKLDEIAAITRKTEVAIATFHSRREEPMPEAEPVVEEQPSLALGPAIPEVDALASDDFIRALNFPETAEDHAGFAALRRAMKDRQSSQLIQAAQDILTLLSQDGIYMDDLRPDRARPDVWRQFGNGARGRSIGDLGGIHDPAALSIIGDRMKQDPIFRDVAHHFLRRFDRTFAEFEKIASDGEISALAETRTARAFMLLGRVAGTFD